MVPGIASAIRRARPSITIMTAMYAIAIGIGIGMVHAQSGWALQFRDRLIARARAGDPAALANRRGFHARAAAIDFARNLGLVAIPDTVGGLTLIIPIARGAYGGWVGGVVSVDNSHQSRFRNPRSAAYYIVVMLFQVSGFSLAGASGLHLGWAFIRREVPFVGPTWFRLPKNALIDVGWIYTLIVPLFAIGSLIEFLWQ